MKDLKSRVCDVCKGSDEGDCKVKEGLVVSTTSGGRANIIFHNDTIGFCQHCMKKLTEKLEPIVENFVKNIHEKSFEEKDIEIATLKHKLNKSVFKSLAPESPPIDVATTKSVLDSI